MFQNKKVKEKLLDAIHVNKITIYSIWESKLDKLLYASNNVEDVLKTKADLKDIYKEIKAIPIIEEELDHWNKKDEFVSGMVQYRPQESDITTWIRLKIYPIYEKKKTYHIVMISDMDMDHERQHTLVKQAADIKSRDQKLNQITSFIYDIEATIDLNTENFEMRNLKETNNYFGSNKNGNYKEVLDTIINDYIKEEDQETLRKTVNDLSKYTNKLEENKNTAPVYLTYHLKDKDITLESVIFTTASKEGVQITILTHDVTENMEYVKRQNIELQKALDLAKETDLKKQEFLSILSHEIRSPMNVILGLSESILNSDISNDIKEDIESINTASNNLIDVINGILNMEVESPVNEKEYDVVKLIRSLEMFTKEKIGKKDIRIDMAVDPKMPSVLFGDGVKIRQIMENLLTNAATYTEAGSISIGVKWSGTNEAGKFILSVSDTGCGIDSKQLSTLLNTRMKLGNDKNYHSGMGIYVSKKYIALLNGEMEAESTVGKGTTFTISINQKVISEKPVGDIYARTQTKATKASFNAAGKRILVVDDDKLNLKVAVRLLKPYNADVVSLESGKEALELLKKEKFDLLLLDQMMPEMSGTDTLKAIQEEKIKIKTVLLTADANVGKKELYLKAGFDDFLAKPIHTEELHEILKKYLK